MISIEWCLKQKKGMKILEPNENVADSYLNMAEDSIRALSKLEKKNKIWSATMSYYICYYSLYALMRRIGIKCEIHSCSIKFMKKHLTEFYTKKDVELLEKAFSARIDLQYYTDREVDSETINYIRKYCKEFFLKTKDSLSKIKKDKIQEILERIKQTSD